MKWLISIIVVASCNGCAFATLPASKFTVRVTDVESGVPVTNAVVQTTFEHKYDPWGGDNIIDRRKERVDANGMVVFSGKDIGGSFGAAIRAEGYYQDWAGLEKRKKNVVLNRWEPWNPTFEVKMRPKKNPVPMIQKRIESLKIPAWDEPLGFDLEKGDWVSPHGKGKQVDFLVNMARRFEHSGDYDAVAQITFINEEDGIQLYEIPKEFKSSNYKFPYLSPTNNYQTKLVLERHATLRETKCSFSPKTDKYIFRVRTKMDEDGNIVSACYGRTGRIEIGWGEVFDTSYSFNPNPQSRSLESDKKPY